MQGFKVRDCMNIVEHICAHSEMIVDILIGLVTGLISGAISGYIVYCFTNKREENKRVFQFWEDFLYHTLEKCEMYIPIEEIREKGKIGEGGTDWDNAITAIWDQINPYGHEDTVFSDEQVELSENVMIALKELYKWAKRNNL